MGEYITVEQAAILLHVSPTTVRRWIYQGNLKAKKPRTGRNARVLIDRDDLEATPGARRLASTLLSLC